MVVDENGLYKSDRTRETQRIYQDDMNNMRTMSLLDEPAVVEYKYWKLIVNRYPYDQRWRTSMLLVHKTACQWENLPDESVIELHEIKNKLRGVFDKFEENGDELASIRGIAHIHLLKGLK